MPYICTNKNKQKHTHMKTTNNNNRTNKVVNIIALTIFTGLSIMVILGAGALIYDMLTTGLKYY